jgi:hypothetical protein
VDATGFQTLQNSEIDGACEMQDSCVVQSGGNTHYLYAGNDKKSGM